MLRRRTFLASALATAAAASLPGAAFAAKRRPFKLYDTHAHFYTSNLAKYPPREGLSEAVKARTMAQPITPDYLFKLWAENGVEMGCGVQYNSFYSNDNRYLLDVSARYPKRIVPIVILSPTDPATPATLASMAKANHIAGVRFFSAPEPSGKMVFLTDSARGVWETANELGLAIVLIVLPTDKYHEIPAGVARLAEFADRYPNVNIVLDHLTFPPGAPFTPNFGLSPQHLALARHKNVYYKYTTFLIEQLHVAKVPPKDFLEHTVGIYGADQFVWGSDVGNSPGSFAAQIEEALDSASGLSVAQQKAIFYSTAKRIFVPGGRGPARG